MSSPDVEVQRVLQAARLYLAQGELAEAISRATQAIRLDPKEPSAYLVRAEAHRRQKRPDRSLADLAVAIRLDPQNPSPYVIRAEILKRRNIFDQAIADATHALILDPRNAAAFSIRAECRNAIGDSDGAGEDVQEMLLIDPTRPMPDLGARRANPNSEVELGNERFWKQAGKADLKQQLESFSDGTTVDKTYRSRPVVSNDDAPEALGVASGYKPETIERPIPRFRPQRRKPSSMPLSAGLVCLALLCGGYVLISQNYNPQVANRLKGEAESQKATSQPLTPAASEFNSAVPTVAESQSTPIPKLEPISPHASSATTNLKPATPASTLDRTVPVPAMIASTDTDMKALQGEWLCVAMEEIGNTLNRKAVKEQDRRVTIKGHSYTMKRTENGNRHMLVGKFEIAASNGHFDFVGREQSGGSTVWIGIYELKSDTLRLCYRYKRNEDCTRPTTFETDTNKPNISVYYIFKRDTE